MFAYRKTINFITVNKLIRLPKVLLCPEKIIPDNKREIIPQKHWYQ